MGRICPLGCSLAMPGAVAAHICWFTPYEASLDRQRFINFPLDSLMTPYRKKKWWYIVIVLFLFLWTMTTNVIDSHSSTIWHEVAPSVVLCCCCSPSALRLDLCCSEILGRRPQWQQVVNLLVNCCIWPGQEILLIWYLTPRGDLLSSSVTQMNFCHWFCSSVSPSLLRLTLTLNWGGSLWLVFTLKCCFTVWAARVMSQRVGEHWQATEGDPCETLTLLNQLAGEKQWHSGGSLSCE